MDHALLCLGSVLSVCLLSSALADEDRLTTHAAPKALPDGAVVESWPRILGPHDNAISLETGVLTEWPEAGPTLLWEVRKGEGYTTPAVQGDRLVLFHRMDGDERIECRHPETGALYWENRYPVVYRDQFGYANGPRTSPVIDGERVYTLGVRSMLTCCELATGKIVWQRDLQKEFEVPQYFFGSGSSPLVVGERLVVNVGGHATGNGKVQTVVAFNKSTGETLWTTESDWGASYASPMLASFDGKPRVLVFAGGKSDPPTGGLLLIDPDSGTALDQFPWRAHKVASVNAASPVVFGNRVFLTEAYSVGGICLEVKDGARLEERWRAPHFASHWCTPVLHDGHLYGFDGEKEPLAELVCIDVETGLEKWRDEMRWTEQIEGREQVSGAFRGSLLHVAGRFLCLGEDGALLWLDLSPNGCKVLQRTRLFHATQTWSAPAISKGLVYISQHYRGLDGKTWPRLLCYDFRKAN